MSELKATPGPWSIHNTADIFTGLGSTNAEGISAPSNDGWHIADCDMGGLSLEEVRANANLLRSARELYEALESVNKLIAEGATTGFNCHEGDWADRLFFSQQATSSALKKARGKS